MRRSATYLLTAAVILPLVGCSIFKRKAETTTDAYPTDAGTGTVGSTYYPTESTGMSGGRTHTVQKKETLYSIARSYYNGDHHRWRDIYDANRSEIPDPNKIRVGQTLVIP